MFAVAAVEAPGEACVSSPCACGERKKQRDAAGVLVKGSSVTCAKLGLFATHHGGVEQQKVENKQGGGEPGASGNQAAGGNQEAAEVERIASEGVGAGGGEAFVLLKMTGSPGAKQESEEGNACTNG